MEEEKKTYNSSVAKQWLESVASELCSSTLDTYKLALVRLEAAFHGKEIENTKTRYEERQKYQFEKLR